MNEALPHNSTALDYHTRILFCLPHDPQTKKTKSVRYIAQLQSTPSFFKIHTVSCSNCVFAAVGYLLRPILRWGSCVAHVEAQNALNAAANYVQTFKTQNFCTHLLCQKRTILSAKKAESLVHMYDWMLLQAGPHRSRVGASRSIGKSPAYAALIQRRE
jgi:hypothetical protein